MRSMAFASIEQSPSINHSIKLQYHIRVFHFILFCGNAFILLLFTLMAQYHYRNFLLYSRLNQSIYIFFSRDNK